MKIYANKSVSLRFNGNVSIKTIYILKKKLGNILFIELL